MGERFSHVLLLNDFPPPSRSLEQARNTPKPVDIDKFGGILTCVYFKSCLVSQRVLPGLGHSQVTNQCLAFYHVKLTLQRKIKTIYSENSTLLKRSVKSIKLLLCTGCPALYPSVDKLSLGVKIIEFFLRNVLPVLNFQRRNSS